MIYVNTFDNNAKYLGKMTLEQVHKNGLWHSEVYSFIYDMSGFVYFLFKDLFLLPNDHVYYLENEEEALTRILSNNVSIKNALSLLVAPYEKEDIKDGLVYKNNIICNMYLTCCNDFKNDSYVKIKARSLYDVFTMKEESCQGTLLINGKFKNINISMDDFLINDYELSKDNYTYALKRIIEITLDIKN